MIIAILATCVKFAHENSIIGAWCFLSKLEEDNRAFRCDTNNDEDGEDDDENGAER